MTPSMLKGLAEGLRAERMPGIAEQVECAADAIVRQEQRADKAEARVAELEATAEQEVATSAKREAAALRRVAELEAALVDLRGVAETLYIRCRSAETDPDMVRAFAVIATANKVIGRSEYADSVCTPECAHERLKRGTPGEGLTDIYCAACSAWRGHYDLREQDEEASKGHVQVVRADGHARQDDGPAVPGAPNIEVVQGSSREERAVVGRSALADQGVTSHQCTDKGKIDAEDVDDVLDALAASVADCEIDYDDVTSPEAAREAAIELLREVRIGLAIEPSSGKLRREPVLAHRPETPPVHPSNMPTILDVLETDLADARSEACASAKENEAMLLTIEKLTAELEKPEDVRLREVHDVMAGRAAMFTSLADRVSHILDELDDWIARAGRAERERDELRAVAAAARELLSWEWGHLLKDYGKECGDVVEAVDKLAAALAATPTGSEGT